jgi:radical SAM protein with 4Fe4S-binding SPASM domain
VVDVERADGTCRRGENVDRARSCKKSLCIHPRSTLGWFWTRPESGHTASDVLDHQRIDIDAWVVEVRDHGLADIWTSSPAFNAFRGTAFLPEPCASCERRELDFGGCRCQAFLLTGDPRATDPVCHLSPAHDLVARLAATQEEGAYDYRRM